MKRQLSYANVCSILAIVLSLAGGTAYAIGLKKNSVSSVTVRNNSLKSIDLANGRGVTGADVAKGSLGGTNLAPGSVVGAKIADGSISATQLEPGAVGSAALATGSIGTGSLNAKAIGSANVVDGSIQGSDIAPDTVTGRNVDGSTLGPVRGAFELDEVPTTSFLSSQLSVTQTNPQSTGFPLGDGTFKVIQTCPRAGETMLSGGPVGVNPGSVAIESFAKDNTWSVRINPHGASDAFGVQVLCTGPAL